MWCEGCRQDVVWSPNRISGKMGFKSTASDPRIYIRGSNMIVLYVDEFIILSNTKEEANNVCGEIDGKI